MTTIGKNIDQLSARSWKFWTALGIFGLAGLVVVSRHNYLLFHSLAELFSISVAWAVFFLVWNTREVMENDALVFVGISFFFVGVIDLLHTLAYKGMGVFGAHWGANLATQLWISARYLESGSLLLYPMLIGKTLRPDRVFLSWLGIATAVLVSIFYRPVFPDCYVEGTGLTSFKIVSEYLICLVLCLAFVLLYLKRDRVDTAVFRLISASIAASICGELAFTFYVSVYGISNLVGHFFKIVSFVLLYHALIRTGLTRPYSVLFKSVKERLKTANDRLEREVRQRTRELQKVAYEFESLFDSSQVGMMVLRGGRFFSKGNQRLADILGYETPEEMEGFSMQSLHLDEERFREFGEKYYDKLSQGEILHVEYQLRRKDGAPVWCSMSGKALDAGEPVDLDKGVLWIVDDIGERKHAEHVLKTTLDQLERYNDELAQFAYVASHDLQEPLRAIVGFLQLLETRYHGQLDAKGRHYIERSVKAGHRMQRLISDLLALSRVNTRDKGFETTDFNEIMDKVVARLQSRIKQKNAGIVRGRLPSAMADASQMETLFFNLVSNALKYNESQAPQVEIGWSESDSQYRFHVKDNGIGISPKFYDRIFIVFQRLHGRREYSGTGVGLTLCKKIVERHGGRIWVESEAGAGSTFFFTLPSQRRIG